MTANPTLTRPPLAFPPVCPTMAVPPTKIADDTWVIHQVQPALGQPLDIYLNSMVILGSEPVIVDTGTPANRTQWLEDVFALVEPEDVRWIFLSHDDVDHTGNLDEALSACPNATVVCNWAMVERHTNCFDFPLASVSVGDRRRVVRRRRPDAAGDPPTGVRLADHARAVRPEDAGVLGGRHVRDTAARRVDGHRRSRPGLLGVRVDAVRAGRGEPVDHLDRSGEVRPASSTGCRTSTSRRSRPATARSSRVPTSRRRSSASASSPRSICPTLPDQSILDEIIAATAQPPAGA